MTRGFSLARRNMFEKRRASMHLSQNRDLCRVSVLSRGVGSGATLCISMSLIVAPRRGADRGIDGGTLSVGILDSGVLVPWDLLPD